MIIEGGGFPIRDKLLKLVEEPSKSKKNGKAKRSSRDSAKSDVLEITAENVRASRAKVKDFDQAVELLNRTTRLISRDGDISSVHSGSISSSLIKIIVS